MRWPNKFLIFAALMWRFLRLEICLNVLTYITYKIQYLNINILSSWHIFIIKFFSINGSVLGISLNATLILDSLEDRGKLVISKFLSCQIYSSFLCQKIWWNKKYSMELSNSLTHQYSKDCQGFNNNLNRCYKTRWFLMNIDDFIKIPLQILIC